MGTCDSQAIYRFTLYITDKNATGQRTYQNLQSICQEYIPDKYSINVVDLKSSSGILLNEMVLAIPMVVRKAPLPEIRIIGDLSDRELAIRALGIEEDQPGKPPSKRV